MSIKIEHEEDFMSYLNTDYMSTEAPLSPPNSIGYASEKQGDMLLDPFWTVHDHQSFMSEPKKRGRKKREIAVSPGPKPLAPYPAPAEQKPIAPKEAQLAKRQERLIKNRAAALISRKRKREHLFSLEEENRKLHEKVDLLEKQIQTLSQENLELKSVQWPDSPVKKPAQVVFMRKT
ncbi:hypothetical protein BY458DRAFT_206720 [Sporodiniella umbellata]|nr:hypothetical protein BY458DRAFT_206720 [Sporodiniella umbellata]